MNKSSEMMAFGESNWKDSWIAPDGWKEFSQSKTIMRGWHQARITNLQENGQDLRETLLRSSHVENDDENHHELLTYSGRMKNEEVEPTMKRIWKILEEDIWLMIIHSYVKLGKELENEWRYLRKFGTRERRDHELIRGYLNDAPVRFGEQELKVENE